MSTIRDIGEFGLIERLQRFLPTARPDDLLHGIGDDCAVIQTSPDRCWALTVDMQLDDVHFRSSRMSWFAIGRRAISVNLSDLAAMGATPRFALVSLALPANFATTDFDELYRGIATRLTEFGGVIIGGNLAGTAGVVTIDITLIGELSPQRMLLRSGARVGDQLCVVGKLGSAAAGFHLLELNAGSLPDHFEPLLTAHVDPFPHCNFAGALAANGLATAAIDLSDGLAGDLAHLCHASGCGATLLPLSNLPSDPQLPEAISFLRTHGVTTTLESLVLRGGEDYALLFAVPPTVDPQELRPLAVAHDTTITHVGTLTAGPAITIATPTGETTSLLPQAFDHFRP